MATNQDDITEDGTYRSAAQIQSDNEQFKENKTGTLTFKRFLEYSKREIRLIIIGVIASMFAAVTRLSIPLLVGAIIDSLTTSTGAEFIVSPGPITWMCNVVDSCKTPKQLMLTSVITMCITGILSALFNYLQWTLLEIAGERVVARLRNQLFDAIISFEVGFFDQNKTGELINRLATDTTEMKQAATSQIAVAISSIMNTVLGVTYLLFISWDLTLVMLSSVPIIVISGKLYGNHYRKLSKTNQDILAKATEIANESFTNIRTVKSFSKESDQTYLYHMAINSTYIMGKRMALTLGGFIFFITALGYLNVALVLWYGSSKVLNNNISSGALTSYLLITITIAFSLVSFVNFFSIIMKALGAGDRVFNIFDRETKINPNGGIHAYSMTQREKMTARHEEKIDREEAKDASLILHNDLEIDEERRILAGNIEFDNVTFYYPSRADKLIFEDLSFLIPRGSITALVGESGHGKSSIVSLLMRFYDVRKGEIKIDDVDIKHYNLPLLHSQIGFVSQEPILFARSIRDNILFGKLIDREHSNEYELQYRNVNEDALISAAKQADCHNFIMSFTDKYDTLCGERGVRLSGGQRQRIAIARAILMDPKILLLDEATSSLDAKSEALVQNALNNVMKGRTVVVIAHRLSTVKEANNILVVEHGRIVEQGTHQQLLQMNDGTGVYAKLVDKQMFK